MCSDTVFQHVARPMTTYTAGGESEYTQMFSQLVRYYYIQLASWASRYFSMAWVQVASRLGYWYRIRTRPPPPRFQCLHRPPYLTSKALNVEPAHWPIIESSHNPRVNWEPAYSLNRTLTSQSLRPYKFHMAAPALPPWVDTACCNVQAVRSMYAPPTTTKNYIHVFLENPMCAFFDQDYVRC